MKMFMVEDKLIVTNIINLLLNILYFLNPVRLFRRFVIRRGNLNRFRNLVNRSETAGGMTENKSNDGMSVNRGIKKYEKRILLAKGKKKRSFFNLKNSIILIILFMTFVYIHFSGYSIKSMYVSIFIFIAITLYLLIVERFNEKVNFENEIREIKNERTKEHDVFLEKVKDIEQLEKNQLENIILKNCDDYDIKVWKIGRATSLLLGKKTPRNKVDIDVGEAVYGNLVSRAHGILNRVNGLWYYEDLGSQNGSGIERIRDKRKVKLKKNTPVKVESGDIIYLATTKLLLK